MVITNIDEFFHNQGALIELQIFSRKSHYFTRDLKYLLPKTNNKQTKLCLTLLIVSGLSQKKESR